MRLATLTNLKQTCDASYAAFATESAKTHSLLAEVELPISKVLRGSLLQQLQVEHEAEGRYRSARQTLLQFVQEHYRRPE